MVSSEVDKETNVFVRKLHHSKRPRAYENWRRNQIHQEKIYWSPLHPEKKDLNSKQIFYNEYTVLID